MSFLLTAAVALCAAPEPPAKAPDRYEVPYRLTDTKHVLVRTKLNGKGPYNFILDTGAPAVFIPKKIAKDIGLKLGNDGWGTLDSFEVEAGLKVPGVRTRVEDLFQLEGMNGMGLAGMEIHGLLGYQALAKFRMEIDFTKDKLVWTELNYKPTRPQGFGGKGGGAGNLEAMGGIMKTLGWMMGRKANPEVTMRGFYGMTLADDGDNPKVEAVLEKGPAGAAGLKVGDVLRKVNGRTVTNVTDVVRVARGLPAGKQVKLSVERGKDTKEITVTSLEGI